MSSLDTLDGGAGSDTLNIVDGATAAASAYKLPIAVTVGNIETLNVTSTGAIGATGSGNRYDVSGFTGLTTANFVSAGSNASFVGLAGTTNATLATVDAAGGVDVTGGASVSATIAGTGTASVVGAALTSVSVKGGGGATVDNLGGTLGTTTSTGKTLTTVTLAGVDGDSAVKGAAVATLNISGATTAARTVTVTNATVDHALTLNVNGTGVSTARTTVADSAAATVNIVGSGTKSVLALTAGSALTLNLSGSAALDVSPVASVTKIDGSTATGALTLGSLNAGTVSVATGSANDSFTVNATTKAAIDAGAGNDTVTLGAALAATSSVNLGDGDDKLTVGTAFTAGATLAGGAGTDTLAASYSVYGTITGASYSATKVTGFEVLQITDALADTNVVDLSKYAFNNVTLSAVAISGTATVAGLSTGGTVTLGGAAFDGSYVAVNTGAVSIDTSYFITGAADVVNLNLNRSFVDNNDTTIDNRSVTSTVVADYVEVLNVKSTATQSSSFTAVSGYKADIVTNTLVLDGSNRLTTLNVTGDQRFSFTSTAAMNQLSTIDASAVTANVTINAQADLATSPILTIKGSATAANNLSGGDGADTIIGGAKADTLSGGAGADTISGGAGNDTITGGLGADVLSGGTGRDVFVFGTGATADSRATSTGFDKISDFGAVSTALTAAQSAALTSTVATAQGALTDNGGDNADILDLAGTPTLFAAAAITQASTGAMSALATATGSDVLVTDDIKYAISSKGVITLSGADAAKVNTVSEWVALLNNVAENTAAAKTVAFGLNGNTYVFSEGGTNGDTLVELTALSLASGTGLAILGASTAVSAGDILIG